MEAGASHGRGRRDFGILLGFGTTTVITFVLWWCSSVNIFPAGIGAGTCVLVAGVGGVLLW